jgi:uncharacterized protein (DUF1330 family)
MTPKGYVIFTMDIHDQAGMDSYVQATRPTLFKAGGRPIVGDDNPEVIEGEWHGSRTVILEFDSVEAAHTWYRSPEYQAVVGQRHACAKSNVAIVSGFEMP